MLCLCYFKSILIWLAIVILRIKNQFKLPIDLRFQLLKYNLLLFLTGQKLVEWHQLDVTSFLDQVTGFLGEHGQLDGHSTSPPQKRTRSVSIMTKTVYFLFLIRNKSIWSFSLPLSPSQNLCFKVTYLFLLCYGWLGELNWCEWR